MAKAFVSIRVEYAPDADPSALGIPNDARVVYEDMAELGSDDLLGCLYNVHSMLSEAAFAVDKIAPL